MSTAYMFFCKLSGCSFVLRFGHLRNIISSKDYNILDAFLVL